MIVHLIHNPASGTHHELRLDMLAQAFAACGAKVVMGETQSDGCMLLANDSDLICVSGGDGTLRLVIAAMRKCGSTTPVCIFPAGTVNLVAREIGYSFDPEQFAREVIRGYLGGAEARLKEPVAASDTGPFAACLSAGPDGVAVARHSPRLKKAIGRTAYAWSFAKLFLHWPSERFLLYVSTADGTKTSMACEAFYIAKGRYFAGPWALTPEAGLGQNDFQLIALTHANRSNYIRFILAVICGKDIEALPFIRRYRAQSVTIDQTQQRRNNLFFQEDGDIMAYPPSRIMMSGYVIEYCLPLDD